MTRQPRILLIEDDAKLRGELLRVIESEGFRAVAAETGESGLALSQVEAFDLALTDLRLPGMDGIELVKRFHAARPRLPVILMTAHGTTETAIEATRLGAYDYLLKPFDMGELLEIMHKALASSRLTAAPVSLGEHSGADAIIGSSRAMQQIYKEIGRAAALPVTVLLRGETGTGKELVARALWQHSDRADAPFIAVNCAAIPETLLESELFGHERGAFTGAEARRIGRFEQAHGGTLFLDEIGDMSMSTQVKLLRVLQERCIQRVGGRETIPADTRIIASTHRELEKAITEGEFREDLFHRLNVAMITLPPLRDRSEDIPALARYFIQRYGVEFGVEQPAIEPGALALLTAEPWPGNVRQLENVVRKALLAARGFTVGAEEIRAALSGAFRLPTGTPELAPYVAALLESVRRGECENIHAGLIAALERELFTQAIRLAGGNQAQAARWLGVSRPTVREKLLQFGSHPQQETPPP